MRKVFLIFLLPFTMILQCRGQENSPLTQLQRDFFEALFHLDIAHAESLLTEIENTDTTEGIIAKTQLLWWKNISTGKPIKPLLRYIEEITNSYPEMPIALSMHLNSMRLRIHTTEKNYLRAWKEWKIFEDSLDECTQICDHDTELFIRGVYHCMKADDTMMYYI